MFQTSKLYCKINNEIKLGGGRLEKERDFKAVEF